MSSISQAPLDNVTTGKKIEGQELWKAQPACVIAFRRPGCVLCRDEAQRVWSQREDFAVANVRLVGLVHENKGNEVADFQKFWPGELYIDSEKAFYNELGGGTARKGRVVDLINPFSQAWKHVRTASKNVEKHNLKGDGLTMGGEMVVATSGKVAYAHPETTFGDHAPVDELLAEAKKAAGAS